MFGTMEETNRYDLVISDGMRDSKFHWHIKRLYNFSGTFDGDYSEWKTKKEGISNSLLEAFNEAITALEEVKSANI
jgi:hypothetical protein